MTDWLDRDTPIGLTCVKCAQEFSKTLRELETENSFPCSNCGIVYVPSDFKSTIKAVEKELSDFMRDLNRLFK